MPVHHAGIPARTACCLVLATAGAAIAATLPLPVVAYLYSYMQFSEHSRSPKKRKTARMLAHLYTCITEAAHPYLCIPVHPGYLYNYVTV